MWNNVESSRILRSSVRRALIGATKSYFLQYSCVAIVLFNKGLCKSAFSTVSFRKLVFLSFCAFFMLWIKTLKYASSCYVILICYVFLFSPYIKKLTFYKYLNKKAICKSSTVLSWICKKHAFRDFLSFSKKKISFINKSVEQLHSFFL